MTTPVWRNDDLEGAVIGAFFLYERIRISIQASADRPVFQE